VCNQVFMCLLGIFVYCKSAITKKECLREISISRMRKKEVKLLFDLQVVRIFYSQVSAADLK